MRLVYVVIFVLASFFVGYSTVFNIRKAGSAGYKALGLSKAGFLGREFSKLILGIGTAYVSVLLLDLAVDGIKTLLLR